MAFTKITSADLNSRGATTLPNQPMISAQALKQEFDAPAKEVVAPKFNKLIDDLEAGGASSIGATAPTGYTGDNVQAILNALGTSVKTLEASQVGATAPTGQSGSDVQAVINSLGVDLADLNSKKHTHDNKSLLDSYTQTNTDLADAVSKKHSHSNQSVLDKISEDASGNPTFDGNVIPTAGSTGGLQTFIGQDLLEPSSGGQDGDLCFVGQDGESAKDLYRNDNGEWTKVDLGTPIEANPSGSATARLDTVLIDDTNYFIPQDGHIYSGQEHIVGKWTNGNDVYERTYKLAELPGNGQTIQYEHNIGGIGLVLYTEGMTNESNAFTDLDTNNEISVDDTYINLKGKKAQNGYAYLTIGYTRPQGGYYPNSNYYAKDTGSICTGWNMSLTKTETGECYAGMLVWEVGNWLYWGTFVVSKTQATAEGATHYHGQLTASSFTYNSETWYYTYDGTGSLATSTDLDGTTPASRRYWYGQVENAITVEDVLEDLLDSIYA